jgi:hypothetical protein
MGAHPTSDVRHEKKVFGWVTFPLWWMFKPDFPHSHVENCGVSSGGLVLAFSGDFDFVKVVDEFEAGFQEFAGLFQCPLCFGDVLVLFHLYHKRPYQRVFQGALRANPVSTLKLGRIEENRNVESWVCFSEV